MRSVSRSVLGRPEGFDEGIGQSPVFDRVRQWLGGGRFWSVALVLLLTLTVAKSTTTVHWVDGLEVITPIALLGALALAVLALLPVREPIALAVGAILGPVAALVGAWPRLHAYHPSDVLSLQLINVWWERLQNGAAAQDPAFFLALISLLMWVTGAWLSWCVVRWRKPMLGLIPGAAAFSTNVLNIPTDQNGYVLAMLILTLALLLWTNYTSSIANAGRAKVKLTGDAKWDFWESGLVATAGLIVLGIMLPPLSTMDRTLDVESGLFTSWAQLQQRLSNPGIFTTGGGHGVTGFTDDVKLSGNLQKTRDIVFEYTTAGDYAGPRYFRGLNETTTIGREWRYAPQNGFQEIIPSGGFADFQESYTKLAGVTVHVAMRAPPVGFQTVLFYPGQLLKIDRTTLATQVPLFGGPLDSTGLWSIDRLDSIKPANSAGSYAVTVDFSTATVSDLQSAGTAYPDWLTFFTRLPAVGYRTPEVQAAIKARAEEIVRAKNATNPYDMAAAIEAYLRDSNNFKYSLSAVPPPGQDPISWFLFTGKTGYCEFFATAMGDMLRSLGIPTRLVNGFGPGTFNVQTEDYVVRGEDAHTWVEVYFPSYGWIPFEPTPDDLGQYNTIPRGQTGANPCLRDTNCVPPDQIAAGTGGSQSTPKGRPGLVEPIVGAGGGGFSIGALTGGILTKGLGVVVALLLLLLVALLRYLRPRTMNVAWRRMLTLANLAGAERRPGETPLELGRRLQRTFPEASESMGALAGAYNVAAYAPPDEAAAQKTSVMEAWVSVRPMLLRRILARLRPTRI